MRFETVSAQETAQETETELTEQKKSCSVLQKESVNERGTWGRSCVHV